MTKGSVASTDIGLARSILLVFTSLVFGAACSSPQLDPTPPDPTLVERELERQLDALRFNMFETITSEVDCDDQIVLRDGLVFTCDYRIVDTAGADGPYDLDLLDRMGILRGDAGSKGHIVIEVGSDLEPQVLKIVNATDAR